MRRLLLAPPRFARPECRTRIGVAAAAIILPWGAGPTAAAAAFIALPGRYTAGRRRDVAGALSPPTSADEADGGTGFPG